MCNTPTHTCTLKSMGFYNIEIRLSSTSRNISFHTRLLHAGVNCSLVMLMFIVRRKRKTIYISVECTRGI